MAGWTLSIGCGSAVILLTSEEEGNLLYSLLEILESRALNFDDKNQNFPSCH